ncbi:hypothetical protein P5808_05340 [Bacillus cereus]|uniref:hypothetical protein n=2 Tax=Bacillus TaxID=1386 RepID=UPI0001A00B8E|nr:hypothetical protein [Bacillus cereus]EEK75682.1 hypothetical protein bcere0009_54700 [Bacillus cereus R309803]MDF9593466.1 hypothetical protein [Bacillus cereus]HDR4563354.1 hypothetical protein [Bacillus luti]
MNHRIQIHIRIGSKIDLENFYYYTDDWELDALGSQWGERMVLNLGQHFNVYRNQIASEWALSNTLTTASSHLTAPILVNPFTINIEKDYGSSISGNFGEVLTIQALKLLSPSVRYNICHLKSGTDTKTPDLFLNSDAFISIYGDYRKKCKPKDRPPAELPNYMPGECKNTQYIEAIRQIASYWRIVGENSDDFGFGLVSNLAFRNISEPKITFTLLIRREENRKDLNKMLNLKKYEGTKIKKLIQKDLGKYLYGF